MKAFRLALLCCGALPLAGLTAERALPYGAPFGDIAIYTPEGKPRSVVLFLSGDGGWHLGVVSMARHLVEQGAIVVGLDVRHYLAEIAAHPTPCRYMAADLETLSHRVQRELKLESYLQPLLYGYSSGATVMYAALVQSPPGTFGGAVSLGFCPDQKFGGAPLCPGPENQLTYKPGAKGSFVFDPAPKLKDRWVAFQGQSDKTCPAAAVAAYAAQVGSAQVVRLDGVGHGYGNEKKWLPQYVETFNSLLPAPAPVPVSVLKSGSMVSEVVTEVGDLPLIELSAVATLPGAPLAILLSGDGGWAGIDKGIAAELAARGLPVVGLSTLKYYWQARTPEGSAADLARIMRHYMAAWKRERVLLVGYSFGANVLPFIVNRLPVELRSHVAGLALLGLEPNTSFEIRVSGWLPGTSIGTLPVRPEIEKLQDIKAVCLYGRGEKQDPCSELAGLTMRAYEVGKGHHFSGDYVALTDAILNGTGSRLPETRPTR